MDVNSDMYPDPQAQLTALRPVSVQHSSSDDLHDHFGSAHFGSAIAYDNCHRQTFYADTNWQPKRHGDGQYGTDAANTAAFLATMGPVHVDDAEHSSNCNFHPESVGLTNGNGIDGGITNAIPMQLYSNTFSSAIHPVHQPTSNEMYISPSVWNTAQSMMEDDCTRLLVSNQYQYLQSASAIPTRSSIGALFADCSSSPPSSTSSRGSTSANVNKPKRRRVQSMPQRKAANVRERRRMFHLNSAFDELRKRLPAFTYEKRLSRIETLRLAMTYIGFMKVCFGVIALLFAYSFLSLE